MKIPETTSGNPYIEFRFDEKGKLSLDITNHWWGGKKTGFISSKGYEGNSCPPDELESYIEAFKKRKVKALQKEIKLLQIKLKNYQK